ncbi:hypothetical protein QBC38DRAFT_459215 [Podospora fimiseda]|uniref:Uncharacterized protein n=1 Tax=Podospora fimiseda TaxID=252190 RepID=A0AAN7BHP9_9PEZI|nr:hypothetical protein QBC38DRAFT_459215 [Podospora fimiseda]
MFIPLSSIHPRDESKSNGLTSAQTAAIIVFSLLIGLAAICTIIWCACCRGQSRSTNKEKRKVKLVRHRAARSESPQSESDGPLPPSAPAPPPMGFSGGPGPVGPPPIVVVGEGPRWNPGTFNPGLDPRRSGMSVPVVVPGREGIHNPQSGMVGFDGRSSLERMESRSRGSSMSQQQSGDGIRRPPPVIYYAEHRLQANTRGFDVESPLPRQGTVNLAGMRDGIPYYQESSDGHSDVESRV